MNAETTAAVSSTAGLAGKYLTFALADEEYGLPVLKVREIIKMMDITEVPQVPAHVKGVINLRGKVIPVIDLRLKFGFPQGEATPSAPASSSSRSMLATAPGDDGHHRRPRVRGAERRRPRRSSRRRSSAIASAPTT